MTVYIYALECPAGKIRYIGKTNNPEKRLRKHISKARYNETKSHAANWIRSLLKRGEKPVMRLLTEMSDDADWVSAEISAIAHYKAEGCDLTNATAGGEGVCELDPVSRAKMVIKRLATVMQPENRKRYSRTLKEVYACPERRAARSKMAKAIWERPGYKERVTEAFVGSERQKAMLESMTPEVRKRQGNTFSEKYKDPEFRAKMSAALIEVNSRPEIKESKRKKMSAAWQNPEYVENQKWLRVAKAMSLSIKLSDPREQERRAAVKAERAAEDAIKAKARRAAQKAAKLAATTSAPYTESS